MRMRNIILWLTAIVVVIGASISALGRERLATTGRLVYLELAPVDPRSLIQGDYMRLRYAISREAQVQTGPRKGLVVVGLDDELVAHYVRIHNSQTPLAENEILIAYIQRDFNLSIGPESFFFQEGHARYYEDAHYAELRVSDTGDVLLIGLRGEHLEALGPP